MMKEMATWHRPKTREPVYGHRMISVPGVCEYMGSNRSGCWEGARSSSCQTLRLGHYNGTNALEGAISGED